MSRFSEAQRGIDCYKIVEDIAAVQLCDWGSGTPLGRHHARVLRILPRTDSWIRSVLTEPCLDTRPVKVALVLSFHWLLRAVFSDRCLLWLARWSPVTLYRVVGIATQHPTKILFKDGEEVELAEINVFVSPRYRRHGFASMLLYKLGACPSVAFPQDERGRAFYERNGVPCFDEETMEEVNPLYPFRDYLPPPW